MSHPVSSLEKSLAEKGLKGGQCPPPVLAQLPEHLKIIEETKKNVGLVVLSGLLHTEHEVVSNWAGFGGEDGEKKRIAWWIYCLNDSTDHCGDCIKVACSCILCHSLGAIDEANEELEESKKIWIDLEPNQRINQLIAVVLKTQPQKRFNDPQEERDFYGDCSCEEFYRKYHEVYNNENGIIGRIERAGNIDDWSRVNELLDYTSKCLQLDQKALDQWWTDASETNSLPLLTKKVD